MKNLAILVYPLPEFPALTNADSGNQFKYETIIELKNREDHFSFK